MCTCVCVHDFVSTYMYVHVCMILNVHDFICVCECSSIMITRSLSSGDDPKRTVDEEMIENLYVEVNKFALVCMHGLTT